jgi:hypothetical protein
VFGRLVQHDQQGAIPEETGTGNWRDPVVVVLLLLAAIVVLVAVYLLT